MTDSSRMVNMESEILRFVVNSLGGAPAAILTDSGAGVRGVVAVLGSRAITHCLTQALRDLHRQTTEQSSDGYKEIKKENTTYPTFLFLLFTFTKSSNTLNTEPENSSVDISFSEGIEGKGTELGFMGLEVQRLNEKSARGAPTREREPEVVRA